jgi:hypothetical protein
MTRRLQAKIGTNQEKIEAEIKANNEKFEVLQSTTESIQEEIIAKMDIHQERIGSQCECLAKRDSGLPSHDGGLSEE